MTSPAIDSITLNKVLVGEALDQYEIYNFLESIQSLTNVLEGAVAPTFQAIQHQWYLDTVANKYYRNVDGGTTWVALN